MSRAACYDVSPYTIRRAVVWLSLLAVYLTPGGAVCGSETGRYIVLFQPGTPVAIQEASVVTAVAHGGTVTHRLPLVHAVGIRLPAAQAAAALGLLRHHATVQDIVVDAAVRSQSLSAAEGVLGEGGEDRLITPAVPQDVDGGYTWNLLQMALDCVTPATQGAGVGVAVLDTGIDTSHPALAGAVAGGYNARAGEDVNNFADRNGHGTHIAGIIAARLSGSDDDDAAGAMRGVAPAALLYAVRVLDDAGGGFVSDVINGLHWVYAHPEIKVVNLSLGFYKEAPYPLLEQAVQGLYNAGVVLVAAAGNYRTDCIPVQGASGEGGEGTGGQGEGGEGVSAPAAPAGCNTQVKFPARYPQVMAVAATDSLGRVSPYSLRGTEIAVVAPGGSHLAERVMSTYTTSPSPLPSDGDDDEGAETVDSDDDDDAGLYGWGSGTSQAAAHVTGLVALLLGVNPALTPQQVRTIVQTAAVDLGVSATTQGAGRIDAARAVALARQMVP